MLSSNRKWTRGSLGVAGAAAALLAISPSVAQAASSRDRTVIVGYPGQLNTIDPMRSDYGQTDFVDNLLYDTLVTYNHDNKVVGRLAAEFKLADDAMSV